MSEVYGGIAGFACFVIWLGLGGYACAKAIASGTVEKDNVGSMMLFCLVLAPFAFGFSLATKQEPKINQTKEG